MRVMHETEQPKPRIRRLGDRLGAWYTPLALAVAGVAGFLSADAHRFLAVVVIATPCPLLLGIPTAIVGAISLSARRGIIIKNPGILEQIASCRTLIFDKTGTLTYGRPALTAVICSKGFDRTKLMRLIGSLEQYSKHPLAAAIVTAAKQENLALLPVAHVSERPGEGLLGIIEGQKVQITAAAKSLRSNFLCRTWRRAWNVWSSSTAAMRRRCAFTTRRARTAALSSRICARVTACAR